MGEKEFLLAQGLPGSPGVIYYSVSHAATGEQGWEIGEAYSLISRPCSPLPYSRYLPITQGAEPYDYQTFNHGRT